MNVVTGPAFQSEIGHPGIIGNGVELDVFHSHIQAKHVMALAAVALLVTLVVPEDANRVVIAQVRAQIGVGINIAYVRACRGYGTAEGVNRDSAIVT
ncbi:MAG: hypothetical protein P8166_05340 [Candidatus Thiodiazotropha sp.]